MVPPIQLEVLHAALNNKEASRGRTFFYLRDHRFKREELLPRNDDASSAGGKDNEKKEEVNIQFNFGVIYIKI